MGKDHSYCGESGVGNRRESNQMARTGQYSDPSLSAMMQPAHRRHEVYRIRSSTPLWVIGN